MPSRPIETFALAVAAMLALQAPAAAAILGWEELIDQSVQNYEDPYRALTFDQIDAVRAVAQAKAGLAGDDLSTEQRATLEKRLSDAQALLAADGLDADWLIAQRWVVAERRERAATSGNEAVDGQTVELKGFVIPAPPDDDGIANAYLVPERGMCAHMPPPPPNQMVRMRLADGWQPLFIYEPVRLTGELSITPSKRMVRVVDGFVSMRATFSMDVSDVTSLSKAREVGAQSGEQSVSGPSTIVGHGAVGARAFYSRRLDGQQTD